MIRDRFSCTNKVLALGGSWADDDIDIASISVPIERNKHYPYTSGSYGHGKSDYGGGLGYLRGSIPDNGPPYIIKLLNLPITCDNAFIEDLFKSRYTPFVKFKIVVDPASNILETHIIRKVAFVELTNFQDLGKALKWQDLYYRASRRVIIEQADYRDFQHCIDFNKEHEAEIKEIENNFFMEKSNSNIHDHLHSGDTRKRVSNPHNQEIVSHENRRREETSPTSFMKLKSNPFGNARPVDVASRLQEIDKKLITINHTTVRTLGSQTSGTNANDHSKLSSVTPSKHPKPKLQKSHSSDVSYKKPEHSSSNEIIPQEYGKIQESSHDYPTSNGEGKQQELNLTAVSHTASSSSEVDKNNEMSLAELLGSSGKNGLERKTPSSWNSPRPEVAKPTILKKKVASDSKHEENTDNLEQDGELVVYAVQENRNGESSCLLKEAEMLNEGANEVGSTEDTEMHETTEKQVTRSAKIGSKEEILASDRNEISNNSSKPDFKKDLAEFSKRNVSQRDRTKPRNRRNDGKQHFGGRRDSFNQQHASSSRSTDSFRRRNSNHDSHKIVTGIKELDLKDQTHPNKDKSKTPHVGLHAKQKRLNGAKGRRSDTRSSDGMERERGEGKGINRSHPKKHENHKTAKPDSVTTDELPQIKNEKISRDIDEKRNDVTVTPAVPSENNVETQLKNADETSSSEPPGMTPAPLLLTTSRRGRGRSMRGRGRGHYRDSTRGQRRRNSHLRATAEEKPKQSVA